jgi:hypothetical protein
MPQPDRHIGRRGLPLRQVDDARAGVVFIQRYLRTMHGKANMHHPECRLLVAIVETTPFCNRLCVSGGKVEHIRDHPVSQTMINPCQRARQ